MKNYNKFKFRASCIGKLMTNSRGKDSLSQTTKSYLNQLFVEDTFGRSKDYMNRYMEKGILQEEESITLLSKVLFTDKLILKNQKQISNSFCKGTPDIILDKPKTVIDIKTKWDIFGYFAEDGNNRDYYWQLQTYMWLTKAKKAILVYTLVDTPDHLIYAEVQKALHYSNLEEGSRELGELVETIEKNHKYSDIDTKLRIKSYEFKFDQNAINLMKEKIKQCRQYLNNLALKYEF